MRDVEALIGAVDGLASAYAHRLDAEGEVAIGPVDRLFPTGSAAKLLVLLAFAEQVEAGAIDPELRVTMTAAFRDARPGSGVLRYLQDALSLTLQDCATLMMIVSDNVATDLLLDELGGPATVNEVISLHGVRGASLASPTVWALPPAQFGLASPRGLATAAEQLAWSTPVAERCRAIMWRHQHRDGFARLVPFQPDMPDFGLASPLRLWSKSGSYPTVSCEVGLFETDHARWVLAVMAEDLADWGNGSTAAGPTLRANVSRALYDAWGGPTIGQARPP